MAHPYPPRWTAFGYKGRHSYALTYATVGRFPVFTEPGPVALVLEQFLRAASEKQFSIIAYCFMPDHVHVIVRGRADDSDCKAFVKAAKQYSGFYFKQRHGRGLWERYGHDRVIRDDRELALTIRYIVANPVRAGLVQHPAEYPFLGSQAYTVAELLAWCEYSEAVL